MGHILGEGYHSAGRDLDAEVSQRANRTLDRAVFKGVTVRGNEAKFTFEKDGKAYDLRVGNDGAPGVYFLLSERR